MHFSYYYLYKLLYKDDGQEERGGYNLVYQWVLVCYVELRVSECHKRLMPLLTTDCRFLVRFGDCCILSSLFRL